MANINLPGGYDLVESGGGDTTKVNTPLPNPINVPNGYTVTETNPTGNLATDTKKIKSPLPNPKDFKTKYDYENAYANYLKDKYNVNVDSNANSTTLNMWGNNPHYNAITKTVNYNSNAESPTTMTGETINESNRKADRSLYLDNMLHEIPHKIQADSMGVIPLIIKAIKDEYTGRKINAYNMPGYLEYDAHSNIEQQLYSEFFKNTNTAEGIKLYNTKHSNIGNIVPDGYNIVK